jgi:hypothetical protein
VSNFSTTMPKHRFNRIRYRFIVVADYRKNTGLLGKSVCFNLADYSRLHLKLLLNVVETRRADRSGALCIRQAPTELAPTWYAFPCSHRCPKSTRLI